MRKPIRAILLVQYNVTTIRVLLASPLLEWCWHYRSSDLGIIIRAMLALLAEGYRHYHPSDVSTTTRIMSLLSCAKYSRPLSCMSKTIEAMFLVQYHYYYTS